MTRAARPYVKDGIELDQIAVRGIRVSGYHGVNANEREDGQLFFADVIVHVNTRAAAASDDLTRTVNYSDIADRTAEVLAGSPFQLIEAVAEHIARDLLEIDGIACVDVTVHKPQAPLHVEFKNVSVTIRRDMRDGSLWADKRIGSSAGFSDDPMDPGAGPTRDIMDERPVQPVGAVIALGGNLGDVEPTFREALAALHRVNGIEVRAASPLFRSKPEGGADQPDYLNAVARIHTSLAPRELLAACHGIEMLHGRDRTVPGSARTLDLDIISYERVQGESPDLTLPHPRAHQRGFVLLPWAHMESEATLVPHGRVTDLARQSSFDGVELVAPQWPRVPAPDALAGRSGPSPEQAAPAPTADAGDGGAPSVQSAQPAAAQQSEAPAASVPAPESGEVGQVQPEEQPAPAFAPVEPYPPVQSDQAMPSLEQEQSSHSAVSSRSAGSSQTAASFQSAQEFDQDDTPDTTPVGYAPEAGHVPPVEFSAPAPSPATPPPPARSAIWQPVHETPADAEPQQAEAEPEQPEPHQPEPHQPAVEQFDQQQSEHHSGAQPSPWAPPVFQQPEPQQPEPRPSDGLAPGFMQASAPSQASAPHEPSAADAPSAPHQPSAPEQPGVPRRASFGVLRQPPSPAGDESGADGSQ